jgi:hypothetical protein
MLRSELDGVILDCDPYMPESVCPSGALLLEQFEFDTGSLGWEFTLLILWYVAANAIFLAVSLMRSTGLKPVQPHTDNDFARIAAEEAAILRLLPFVTASVCAGADASVCAGADASVCASADAGVNCDAGHARQHPSGRMEGIHTHPAVFSSKATTNAVATASLAGTPKAPTAMPALRQSQTLFFSVVCDV